MREFLSAESTGNETFYRYIKKKNEMENKGIEKQNGGGLPDTSPLFEQVRRRIITLRDSEVILDADVAKLYGVRTREVNQAVRNNPDKFPTGYILELSEEELSDLRSKSLTANISPKSRTLPKAFTEKGLYMLATDLDNCDVLCITHNRSKGNR